MISASFTTYTRERLDVGKAILMHIVVRNFRENGGINLKSALKTINI